MFRRLDFATILVPQEYRFFCFDKILSIDFYRELYSPSLWALSPSSFFVKLCPNLSKHKSWFRKHSSLSLNLSIFQKSLSVCECSTFFFKLKGFLEASSTQIWIYKLFLISESKNQNTWHLPHKHWLCKCYNVWEDYIEFDTGQAENTSSAERQKTNFTEESVENADDLYEPVLNKIMTTHY